MLNLSTSHEKLIAVAWRTPLFMSFLLCSNIQSTRSCMKWRSTSKQEHPPLGNANRCLYRIMQYFFMSGIRFFVSQGRYTKTMQTTIRKQSWKIIMLSFPNTTFDNGISYWKIQQSGWKACNMLQLTRSLFSAKRTYARRLMNVNHSFLVLLRFQHFRQHSLIRDHERNTWELILCEIQRLRGKHQASIVNPTSRAHGNDVICHVYGKSSASWPD